MPSFDFQTLAFAFAGISLSLIGVLLAGSAMFPELAETAKRTWLPNVIIGLVIIGVASFILGALGG